MAVAISPVALSMKPSDEENSSPLCVMRCIEREFLILPSYLRIQSVGLWSYSRFSCGRANFRVDVLRPKQPGIADEPRQTRQVGYVLTPATARQCDCWVSQVFTGSGSRTVSIKQARTNVAGGGVGGPILMAIIGIIKNKMAKS